MHTSYSSRSATPGHAARVLAAALLLAGCDQHVTQAGARPADPLLASGHGTATDLGMRSVAALNARGDVVGMLNDGRPARWTRKGGVQVLPGLGGASGVVDMNDAGVAVGWAEENGRTAAVRWRQDGLVEKLVPGASSSGASAISNGGLIAGSADGQVFRWSAESGVELLPAPGLVRVIGINERGDIIGQTGRCVVLPNHWGEECTDVISGAAWPAEGEMVALAGLGGDGIYDEPHDINDHGWIVGSAERDFYTINAVIWTLDGQVRALGAPHQNSAAYAVNEDGVIVGPSELPGGAFRWTEAEGMVSLFDDPALQFGEPLDVNARGDIAGTAYRSDGRTFAFLWTAEGGTRLLQPLDGYASAWGLLLNASRTVAGISRGGSVPGDTRGTLWAHVRP